MSIQRITYQFCSVGPVPKQHSCSYNHQLVWLKSQVFREKLSEMIHFQGSRLGNRRPTLELEWGRWSFYKTRASKAPGSFPIGAADQLATRSGFMCQKGEEAPILWLTNQAKPCQMRREFFKLICNQERIFFLLCLEPMYFNTFKIFPIFTSPSFLKNARFYRFLNVYSLYIYSKSSGDVVIWYSPVFWSKNGAND